MPTAKSITVLVVDDQQTMRGLARQCLKKLGVIDVALAASGDAAFDLMQSKKFDAVISDLNMPFVSKPFSVSDVREALEAHLGELS